MSIKKDEAMQDILSDFEQLANLVLNQLDMVEGVISSAQVKIPEDIIASIEENEQQIDKKEVKLSEKIVNTIVLYQPVASDLRCIMAAYRMVISLERISDHVINIVSFLNRLKSPEVFEQLQEVLHNMIIQANRMVREALLSFLNDDRELAIWTVENDIALEEMNTKLIKKILRKKRTEDSNRKFLQSIIRIKEVMSNIERIADHGYNIATASIYYLDGKDIRHQHISEK
ncbi:phosphate uptake regulator PhoU [Bacteroidota bacterium]